MTSYVCGTCGFMTTEPDAKFCPECGGSLSEQTAPKKEKIKKEKFDESTSKTCPSCGEPVLNPNSRFCLNCGVSFDGTEPAIPGAQALPSENFNVEQSVAYPPIETTIPIDKAYVKSCTKLFHLPHGVLMQDNREYGGQVILTNDGVAFYTKKIQPFLIPFEAIESVNQGYKDNLLDIHLVNGDVKKFRLMRAYDWVFKIQEKMNQ